MPIEIHRFGVGHRRSDGPPGSEGVTGQVIHSDTRGLVSELAFARAARIEPHANPNTTWFVVIEGGGWVGVGDERARVAAGEAVLWPADIPHAAWTEHSQMRAIVVEFGGADDRAATGVLTGTARAVPALERGDDDPAAIDHGEGWLAERPRRPTSPAEDAGEPA